MKIIKKINIKKTFKSLKTGVLSTNIFFFLIGLYFSSIAFAAILTVTAIDHRIPAGAAGCFSSQSPDDELNNDRTEDLRDVIWSHDGTMVFTINKIMQLELDLSMNKVRDPFELATVKTSLGIHTCDDIDGFDVNHADFQAQGMAAEADQYRAIHIAQKGKIFYIMSNSSEVHRYDLSISYDFRTAVYKHEFDFDDSSVGGFSISKDGTKMYSLDAANNTPTLKTFSLSPAFDITSATEIHSVDLFTIGVDAVEGENLSARDIEFNNDGSQMFISVFNSSDTTDNKIHQFSLGKNYDVSTATDLGSHTIVYSDIGTGAGISWGFSFSSDGMKLFVVQLATPGSRVDQIHQFDLECPYGVVSCSSDTSASVVSQVELAKQNISLNIDTIFRRFEWIKRNRDNEDLTSHNIDINYPNPLLNSLVRKFEPSLKNNLAALVSNTLNKEEKKKSKWSSWSIVDVSIGDYEEMLLDRAMGIKTKGITLGSDRKIGDNKFLGLALRYGNGSSNIRRTVQNVDLESLTLNIYGIVPTNNNQYINAVLGLSALRYDNKYLGKLSGERNGKQAFASINYRTKNTYGKFNITPTGKLTYGVTELSEFTDFISQASNLTSTNIRFHEDTFVSGEFAGGLLFEMEKYENEEEGTTFQPMGGIEIIYDLSDDITYKYQNVGSTSVNKETITKYYNKKLKTNIGFERIAKNGFTILVDYQKMISINDDCGSCVHVGTNRSFKNENFIIKISKSKEEDTQFAFDFDPLSNNSANLSYIKDINNFNLKLNSNMNLFTRSPDYGANIEISGKF